ncbi:MAG: hypothetical protein EPO24_02965 [Bacteroidetes bacterium]|nr:MAG: hypothetical protein EPO24_02965 [Bacteroidota bacterium]
MAFVVSQSSFAQEHPAEHPKEHPKEHPEKDASKDSPNKEVKVTKELIGDAISSYISNDAMLKGGYFTYYDKVTKTPLVLTLDKVHKDKLAVVDEGLYFACTDFKATDGKMYDLDFFMKLGKKGLEVSEVMVHKVEGEPRYGWYEKEGKWIRK